MKESQPNRELTPAERELVRWMLEHGEPGARQFLSHLERARATTWQCPCGCASFNLVVEGAPKPSGGLHPIADFLFGGEEELSGIFVFEQGGILSGVEVYGLAGDAPKTLPTPDMLRCLDNASETT